MKKAGYIVFFVCLGEFLFCLSVFILLLCLLLGIHSDGARVEKFLASEPAEYHLNVALDTLFSEGTEYKEVRDDSACAKYISPEGIEFISRSKSWDTAGLESLYKELLRNKHGEELYSLVSVTVYPKPDEEAAATHKNYSRICKVPFSHTLLPDDFEISFNLEGGAIALYDGDGITTAEGMADSLSHEYGHHFTRYYMLKSNGEELYDTEYAKLRGLTAENSFVDLSDDNYYYENHYKYILEIAAEDYVTLMGSPATREVSDYKDIMETLYMDGYSWRTTRSSAVQENLTIPMACEAEGLADYFYSFIGEEAPEYDIKKEMNIRINKRSQSYNLVGGYRTFVYYEVEFDKVYGEDAAYVLSVYDPGDYKDTVRPIRTVTSDEKALCRIGNAVRNLGSSVVFNDDGIATGTKIFVVNVITADGELYTSAPFSYTF